MVCSRANFTFTFGVSWLYVQTQNLMFIQFRLTYMQMAGAFPDIQQPAASAQLCTIYIYFYYLLQLGFHPVAVFLH